MGLGLSCVVYGATIPYMRILDWVVVVLLVVVQVSGKYLMLSVGFGPLEPCNVECRSQECLQRGHRLNRGRSRSTGFRGLFEEAIGFHGCRV